MKPLRLIEAIEPRLPDVVTYEPLPCIGEYIDDNHVVHVYPAKPAHGYETDVVCKPSRKHTGE